MLLRIGTLQWIDRNSKLVMFLPQWNVCHRSKTSVWGPEFAPPLLLRDCAVRFVAPGCTSNLTICSSKVIVFDQRLPTYQHVQKKCHKTSFCALCQLYIVWAKMMLAVQFAKCQPVTFQIKLTDQSSFLAGLALTPIHFRCKCDL